MCKLEEGRRAQQSVGEGKNGGGMERYNLLQATRETRSYTFIPPNAQSHLGGRLPQGPARGKAVIVQGTHSTKAVSGERKNRGERKMMKKKIGGAGCLEPRQDEIWIIRLIELN